MGSSPRICTRMSREHSSQGLLAALVKAWGKSSAPAPAPAVFPPPPCRRPRCAGSSPALLLPGSAPQTCKRNRPTCAFLRHFEVTYKTSLDSTPWQLLKLRTLAQRHVCHWHNKARQSQTHVPLCNLVSRITRQLTLPAPDHQPQN